MGFPLFRFTLNNSIGGPLVISEPGGWDEAVLKLERNEEYHSLVEFYDQPLLFYGQDSTENGGLDYIRFIDNSQGPDAQITILIEISHDLGVNYETCYNGLLDITTFKEMDFYKLESGIIRDDFWQKFMNRRATPVDLGAIVDLDGVASTSFPPYTLNLPSQQIRRTFYGLSSAEFIYGGAGLDYAIIDFDVIEISEIEEKFTYPLGFSATQPFGLFTVLEAGSYEINIDITGYMTQTVSPNTIDALGTIYDLVIAVNGTVVATCAEATLNPLALYFFTQYTTSTTLTLNVGDELQIYWDRVGGGVPAGFQMYMAPLNGALSSLLGVQYSSTLTVIADTTVYDTTTDAYLISDAINSVLSKLMGGGASMSSAFFGSICGFYYSIMRGLHIRGYSMSTKPFFLSFSDIWEGINPLFNLGLGYTTISGTDYIEIQEKEDFYNPTTILNLDFVNKIERSYDTKYIFKSIEIGYQKWSAESGSGIDDPQSKRTYRTRFKTVGTDAKILSKFYAASLGIEQTRRNRKELGQDWRLDEDIMIIALNKSSLDQPELGSNPPWTLISGLLNSATRYNIRLSCARMFKRWQEFFNGCLKWYATNDDFTFASGEGNFSMTSTLIATDCEGDGVNLAENQNIDGGAGEAFTFVPIIYDFEHPLTYNEYKLMRDNRKNAIGVSRTDSAHVPCFILNVEYQPTRGKAKFTVLLGQSTPIT